MEAGIILASVVLNLLICHFAGVAADRKGFGYATGFIVCLFFSLLGLLLLHLIPAREGAAETTAGKAHCPKCDELVSIRAKICKYCRSEISFSSMRRRATAPAPKSMDPRTFNYILGGCAGLAVVLVIWAMVSHSNEVAEAKREHASFLIQQYKINRIGKEEFLSEAKQYGLSTLQINTALKERQAIVNAEIQQRNELQAIVQRGEAASIKRQQDAQVEIDRQEQEARRNDAAQQRIKAEADEIYRRELERLKKERGLDKVSLDQ